MKARPILFSGPMVLALLREAERPGTGKTQTRRMLKQQPTHSVSNPPRFSDTEVGDLFICPDILEPSTRVFVECTGTGAYRCMGSRPFVESHCPYGLPGDLLYVREAWAVVDRWLNDCETDPPRAIVYRADTAVQVFDPPHQYKTWPCHWGRFDELKWRPSIHLYRWASRLTLRLTDVHVQRLQEISAEDAVAEGRSLTPGDPAGYFPDTWEAINGKGAWAADPWVWALSFEVIKTNVDQVLKEAA